MWGRGERELLREEEKRGRKRSLGEEKRARENGHGVCSRKKERNNGGEGKVGEERKWIKDIKEARGIKNERDALMCRMEKGRSKGEEKEEDKLDSERKK